MACPAISRKRSTRVPGFEARVALMKGGTHDVYTGLHMPSFGRLEKEEEHEVSHFRIDR